MPPDLMGLGPSPGAASLTLVLPATNRQTAPLGTAFEVTIDLEVVWSPPHHVTQVTQATPNEPPGVATIRVRFAYVEPGRTTAVKLGRIRADVPELTVKVLEVAYHGMHRREALLNRYGATDLYFDGPRWEIRNERGYGQDEPE